MAETTTTNPNTASTWTRPRLACGPNLLFSPASSPSGTNTVAPAVDRAELSGPAHQEMEHGDHQRHRGREGHPDPEPFHPLTLVPDRPDVAAAHRCDRQDTRNGPADRAVGQGERPVVQRRTRARRPAPPRSRRPPSTRRTESCSRPSGRARRKWNEIAVTTRAASVATSRALLDACTVSALRPAASATAATKASIAGQQMEGGGLGPGPVSGTGVDEPDERPGEGQAERHASGRCRPSGHRDPPADDDARHREPEEERPGAAGTTRRRRPVSGARRRRGRSPASTCTSSRTVIGSSA